MLRKTLTIFSLLALMSSMWLRWECQYGKIGYVGASGITLYADYRGIGVGRLVWKIPTSETGFYHRKGWFTTDDTQVPLSILMAFFAICFLYFFLSLHPMRHRKRKLLGLCVRCGYDLRGSKDRCPECGSEFEHKEPERQDLPRGWQVRFLGGMREYSSLVFPLLMVALALGAFVIGSCLQ